MNQLLFVTVVKNGNVVDFDYLPVFLSLYQTTDRQYMYNVYNV